MTFIELENEHAVPVPAEEVAGSGPRNPLIYGIRMWQRPGMICTLLDNEELLIKFERDYWGFEESVFAVVPASALMDLDVASVLVAAEFKEVEI